MIWACCLMFTCLLSVITECWPSVGPWLGLRVNCEKSQDTNKTSWWWWWKRLMFSAIFLPWQILSLLRIQIKRSMFLLCTQLTAPCPGWANGRELPCVACVAWPGLSGAQPISPVSPRLAGCKLSLSKSSWARNVSDCCQGKWLLGDDHILQAT